MLSIKLNKYGEAKDVLFVENKEGLTLSSQEVLIKVLGRSINPSDIEAIKGVLPNYFSVPNIPGFEGFGVVTEVGSEVSEDLIGKRVLAIRGEGTWQEYIRVEDKYIIVLPDYINDNTASQLYINPLSAWVLVKEIFQLTKEDTLIVDACGSSLGRIFAQLSKIVGFKLIAVTRNDLHTAELLDLGADYVLDTSKESIIETVMKLTDNKGAKAAVDCIGGDIGNQIASSVRDGGIFRSVGFLSGNHPDWVSIKSRLDAEFFFLGKWNYEVSLEKWHATFNELIELFEEDQLKLMEPFALVELKDIDKAIHLYDSVSGNKGKVILTSTL